MGGTFWKPLKNWSYLFFSFRMSSSSLSISSSCLTGMVRSSPEGHDYNTRFGAPMGKAPARAVDSAAGHLRSIPSVERILSSAALAGLVDGFGRDNVKHQVNAHLHT